MKIIFSPEISKEAQQVLRNHIRQSSIEVTTTEDYIVSTNPKGYYFTRLTEGIPSGLPRKVDYLPVDLILRKGKAYTRNELRQILADEEAKLLNTARSLRNAAMISYDEDVTCILV